jgi:hypothetical protein
MDANLFADVHTRNSVDLSLNVPLSESGIRECGASVMCRIVQASPDAH